MTETETEMPPVKKPRKKHDYPKTRLKKLEQGPPGYKWIHKNLKHVTEPDKVLDLIQAELNRGQHLRIDLFTRLVGRYNEAVTQKNRTKLMRLIAIQSIKARDARKALGLNR